MTAFRLCAIVLLIGAFACRPCQSEEPKTVAGSMAPIRVSGDGRGFVEAGTGKKFVPRGFNYDHDKSGRLLEDYWHDEWPMVEQHFAQMHELGVNVVRIHLQLARFLDDSRTPNARNVERLRRLILLAESQRLYLDLTGLACYHKQDVPAWYDALDEEERWKTQGRFWQVIAGEGKKSPAVFCYDLMNEPVVPGGKRNAGDWLGPAFAGKHFVQFVTLDQRDRPRHEIARKWTAQLVRAIREVDSRTLITVGLVDWSLDRPGLSSGFIPKHIAPEVDFLAVHLYPEREKFEAALETLAGFAVGKPVIVEETFPLKCSPAELEKFIVTAGDRSAGWISFYWGQTPDELRDEKTISAAIQRDWLLRFTQAGRKNNFDN